MAEPFLEPILRQLRLHRVLPYIPNQAVLLDVGCGHSATFLRTISSRLSSGYGVDFKVGDRQFGNIITQQLILEEQLPFADQMFDVVTMLAVLEHITHEEAILREIYRVLVPGGRLILTVPSIWAQPVLELLSYRLHIVSEAEIRDHKRYYDRQSLHQVLIEKTGFSNFNHRYFQCWMNNFCIVTRGVKS